MNIDSIRTNAYDKYAQMVSGLITLTIVSNITKIKTCRRITLLYSNYLDSFFFNKYIPPNMFGWSQHDVRTGYGFVVVVIYTNAAQQFTRVAGKPVGTHTHMP